MQASLCVTQCEAWCPMSLGAPTRFFSNFLRLRKNPHFLFPPSYVASTCSSNSNSELPEGAITHHTHKSINLSIGVLIDQTVIIAALIKQR